jgi:hypothetical protein
MSSSEKGRESAREIDEWALATILRGLVPFLSPDLLDRALAVARNFRDGIDLLEALNGLGPYLQGEVRLEAAREALDAAWRLNDDDEDPDDFYFANLLHEIAPWLPDAAMEETLARTAEADISDYDRVEVVNELMPYLPDALKAPALEAIWEPSAPSRSYHWMGGVAARLTPELAQRVYDAILEQDDLQYHALTLVRLAPRLPDEMRARGIEIALSAVRQVEFVSVRTSWLVELAPHLPPSVRTKVLTGLLAEIRQVDSAGDRIKTLTEIMPHLPEGEAQDALQEAVLAVRDLKSGDLRLIMITDIVPLLPEPERNEGLDEVLALLKDRIKSPNRNLYVAKLVPHLSGAAQAEAIAMLGETEHVQHLAHVLSDLAPSLGGEAQREALAIVGRIAEITPCADALRAFAIHFGGAQKAAAVHSLATLLTDLAGTEPPAGLSQAEIDTAVAGALGALTPAAE